jgi:PAS domain S-box-containing protein
MQGGSWIKKFPSAITVCDPDGIILEINEKACRVFAKDGGEKLIGKNVLDCHPGKARQKLKEVLENQSANCYTIEKNGVRKMIYQAPS